MKKEFPVFLSKLPMILGMSPQEIVAALAGIRIASMLGVKELGTIPVVIIAVMATRFALNNLDFKTILTKKKETIKFSDFRGKNETNI